MDQSKERKGGNNYGKPQGKKCHHSGRTFTAAQRTLTGAIEKKPKKQTTHPEQAYRQGGNLGAQEQKSSKGKCK